MSVRIGLLGDAAGDSFSSPVAEQSVVGRGGLAGKGAAEARPSWLGGCRGKLWALAELGDGDLDERGLGASETRSADEDAAQVQEEDSSLPEAPTLGGFICRAEELGGSLRRRRTAFAPGGKGSGFGGGKGPARFRRLGDGAGVAAGGAAGRAARAGSAPPETGVSTAGEPRAAELPGWARRRWAEQEVRRCWAWDQPFRAKGGAGQPNAQDGP
nr:uncharacterized protein LOC127331091 [Lolium perenne]